MDTFKKTRNSFSAHLPKRSGRALSKTDLKGLFAPVFTCFKDDEYTTLDTSFIDNYAAFLKAEKITGVFVNAIIGEGPTMTVRERKRNAEAWFEAGYKHNLIVIVHIGGAPIVDVVEMAEHAEKLGVHGVMCLPNLMFKPYTLNDLISYCKLVAGHCRSLAFLYFHDPDMTKVYFDMRAFGEIATNAIPNFLGIYYKCCNMATATKCIDKGILLAIGTDNVIAGSLLMGFDVVASPLINIKPEICWDILCAMNSNNLTLAKTKQSLLNKHYFQKIDDTDAQVTLHELKMWFNDEVMNVRKLGFSAGPTRNTWITHEQ